VRVGIESTDGRRGEAARVGDRERVGEALGGSSNFLHATCSEKFIIKSDFKNEKIRTAAACFLMRSTTRNMLFPRAYKVLLLFEKKLKHISYCWHD
jgi:hypothetical protein